MYKIVAKLHAFITNFINSQTNIMLIDTISNLMTAQCKVCTCYS